MHVVGRYLESLCCPVARSPLRLMVDRELQELNAAIDRGEVRYRCGVAVDEPLEGGLATDDGAWAYRVQSGVPFLLPALRVGVHERVPPSGPGSGAPLQPSPLKDVWVELSRRWGRINPPLRPAPQDLELFQALATETLEDARRTSRLALLLGVTPEIATLHWPTETSLLALDSSLAMIQNVFPKDRAPNVAVALADWKAMPLGDGTCAFLIGDGILTSQKYPEDFASLPRELRRVITRDGVLVIRLFARPDQIDPLHAVFGDLRAGRIANFDLLHWRLSMALHGDLTAGVRLGDIWDAWCEHVPDPQALMRDLGWAPDAARIFDSYRGRDTRMLFPRVSEARELLADGFDQVACRVPSYEDGDRYPTVAYRPRPR